MTTTPIFASFIPTQFTAQRLPHVMFLGRNGWPSLVPFETIALNSSPLHGDLSNGRVFRVNTGDVANTSILYLNTLQRPKFKFPSRRKSPAELPRSLACPSVGERSIPTPAIPDSSEHYGHVKVVCWAAFDGKTGETRGKFCVHRKQTTSVRPCRH